MADDPPIPPQANGEVRIPYGLHLATNRMVHIDHAVRGHASGCVCAVSDCGRPLVARQGERNRWHFAHAVGPGECRYGPETALHRAAKQILLDERCVWVPRLMANGPDGKPVRTAEEPALVTLIDPQQEVRLPSGLIPDVLATVWGQPFAIEIRVTHRVGGGKQALIADQRLAAIEITLASTRDVPEGLYRKLVLQTAPRQWLFHPKQGEADAKLAQDRITEAQARAEEERKRRSLGTARWQMPPPLTAEQQAAKEHALASYNARRCAVCGSDLAWFGFGPPLVPRLIWVCRKHRADVDPEMLPDWLR